MKGKKKNKKKPIIVSVIVTLILALGASFSWYLFSKSTHGDTKDLQIMTPYFLYLLNPDDKTSLQFAVGNIHPGETKQIVICVSNKRPEDSTEEAIDIARKSNFNYDLEFIYTENLKVKYDIYELEKNPYTSQDTIPEGGIAVEGIENAYWTKRAYEDTANPGTTFTSPLTVTSDVTEDRHESVFGPDTAGSGYADIINKGKYRLYQYDGNGKELALKYDNEYEYDYYLIEIGWQDGVNFSEYTKETDLLYVVVNAKQPKPIAD